MLSCCGVGSGMITIPSNGRQNHDGHVRDGEIYLLQMISITFGSENDFDCCDDAVVVAMAKLMIGFDVQNDFCYGEEVELTKRSYPSHRHLPDSDHGADWPPSCPTVPTRA